MTSFLFQNVTVIDGTGSPGFRADVAVAGGRIISVREQLSPSAATVIPGDGLVLAPGFIDIHSHSDMTVFTHPGMESKAFQGVTTEVVGNCGLGLFPAPPGQEHDLADYLSSHDFSLPPVGITWHDLNSLSLEIERSAPALNLAPLVGHAPLRMAAMGMADRLPTAGELAYMEQLLAEALAQGAWGLATGLIYPPGSYGNMAELVALCRVVARCDGLYTSHIRSESEHLFAALEEAIAIGRESGARVQISHLKGLGKSNRGRGRELLALLATARDSGVDIGADQYPYDASATTLAAVVPSWAHAGGRSQLLARLADPQLRERLTAEINRQIALREGADRIMVTGCRSPENRQLSGRTIARIAADSATTPAGVVLQLLLAEQGNVGAIFFSMAEEDVRTILADPEVAVGSDGHAMTAEGAGGETTHPRSFGTFPRVLGHYVRDEGVLPLETAIRKMTGLPASRLGFTDRGLIRPGYVADLVLFNPQTIRDRADYVDPRRYAEGVAHLLVAGVPVIRDGRLTGERPGRVLRRGRE